NASSAGFCSFDAQLTLGLELGSRLVGSVVLGCHNIFNKVYKEPFFSGNMPGRGFYTSVQVEF
ncbi:MAG TPA: hypothetical protein PLV25_07870, partial [Opitutales bacterium]|nr:hypothetical protein [Opitutales bacterium]